VVAFLLTVVINPLLRKNTIDKFDLISQIAGMSFRTNQSIAA
jgi:hypothetical protein